MKTLFHPRSWAESCRIILASFCVAVATLTCSTYAYASDIIFASWNIQHLGHGHHKKYSALAAIASKVDLLAVQEVMNEEGLLRLKRALEKHTNETWGHLLSTPVGSKNYKEMYGFLWRNSAVEALESDQLYPDRGDSFIREPFSAKFRSQHDQSEFAVGTVHILYGQGVSDRTPEINALANYWRWLERTYPNTPLVLAGDFNMPPSHEAWQALKRYAKPLITEGASTLSEENGRYANLYDNIWIAINSPLAVSQAGIIHFPVMAKMSHADSRKYLSDHAPVYMALGSATLDSSTVTFISTDDQAVFSFERPEDILAVLLPLLLVLITIFTAKNKSRRQKISMAITAVQKAFSQGKGKRRRR